MAIRWAWSDAFVRELLSGVIAAELSDGVVSRRGAIMARMSSSSAGSIPGGSADEGEGGVVDMEDSVGSDILSERLKKEV